MDCSNGCGPQKSSSMVQGRRYLWQTGEILVARTKIMRQIDWHTHFTALLEVSHPNPNIFPSNLDELENWF